MISWVADLECGVWSRFKKSLGGRRLELELGRAPSPNWMGMKYYGEHGNYLISIVSDETAALADKEIITITRLPLAGQYIPLGEKYLMYPDGVVPPKTLGEAVKFLDLLDGVNPEGIYC